MPPLGESKVSVDLSNVEDVIPLQDILAKQVHDKQASAMEQKETCTDIVSKPELSS